MGLTTAQIQNIFTELFLITPSTKIAQTVLLLWLLKLDINVQDTSLDPLVFYVYSTLLFSPTTLHSDVRRHGAMAPRGKVYLTALLNKWAARALDKKYL